MALLIDVPRNDNEPTPFWLQRRHKVFAMQRKAIKQDWMVSKLVDECLKLGVVPIINYKQIKKHGTTE